MKSHRPFSPREAARAWTTRLTRFAHKVWAGKGLISTLLLPLAWITALVVWHTRRRYLRHPDRVYRSRIPVVVVGNILVGGTGKTPVVMAVIQALQARGWTPGLVSRGYGAPASALPRHGVGALDPAEFGDEPSLIAAQTGVPIAVHPERAHALQVLEQHYPEIDVAISDDGLQHLALGRDVEIAVQDARGCGNGRLLPAGPLREPARRLRTVDFLITQHDAPEENHRYAHTGASPRAHDQPPPHPQASLQDLATPGASVIHTSMTLRPATLHHLASNRSMAFDDWLVHYGDTAASAVAAIGVPQRFFTMLRRVGVRLDHTVGLADHDDYRHPPFARLPDAPILITPKDAIKCLHLQDPRLWAVHPRADFRDTTWLEILEGRLRHVRWSRSESKTR